MIPYRSQLAEALIDLPGVRAVYEIDPDGFVLHAITPGHDDPEAIAAQCAQVLVNACKAGATLGLGTLNWFMAEYRKGRLIVVRCDATLMVVFTTIRVTPGDVLMVIRSAATP